MFMSDVAENEKLNKGIGLFEDRCPSGGDELRSARTGIKYLLGASSGQGDLKKGQKLSKLRPILEDLHDTCLQSWEDKKHVLEDTHRFEAPIAQDDLPNLPYINEVLKSLRPWTKLRPRHAWAAAYNMIFTKHLEGIDLGMTKIVAMALGKHTDIGFKFSFFVECEKVRTERFLARCVSASRMITVVTPLDIVSVFDLLAEQYDDVVSGTKIVLFGVIVDKMGDPKTGNLATGSTSAVTRVAELRKPSAKLRKKLEESACESLNVDKAGAQKKASDQNHNGSGDEQPEDLGDENVGDRDIINGLRLCMEDMQQQSANSSGTSSDNPKTGPVDDDADADDDVADLDLNALFKDTVVGDDDHTDDTTTDEHLRRIIREEAGESLVASRESQLVKNALELGLRASEDACQEFADSKDGGLDEFDAVEEAVLNDARGLGAMHTLQAQGHSCATDAGRPRVPEGALVSGQASSVKTPRVLVISCSCSRSQGSLIAG